MQVHVCLHTRVYPRLRAIGRAHQSAHSVDLSARQVNVQRSLMTARCLGLLLRFRDIRFGVGVPTAWRLTAALSLARADLKRRDVWGSDFRWSGCGLCIRTCGSSPDGSRLQTRLSTPRGE